MKASTRRVGVKNRTTKDRLQVFEAMLTLYKQESDQHRLKSAQDICSMRKPNRKQINVEVCKALGDMCNVVNMVHIAEVSRYCQILVHV